MNYTNRNSFRRTVSVNSRSADGILQSPATANENIQSPAITNEILHSHAHQSNGGARCELLLPGSSRHSHSTSLSTGELSPEEHSDVPPLDPVDGHLGQTLEIMTHELRRSHQREQAFIQELQNLRMSAATQTNGSAATQPAGPAEASDHNSHMEMSSRQGYMESPKCTSQNRTRAEKAAEIERRLNQLRTASLPRAGHHPPADTTDNGMHNSSSSSTLTLVSQLIKDKTMLLDYIVKLQDDKEELFNALRQQFRNLEVQNQCEIESNGEQLLPPPQPYSHDFQHDHDGDNLGPYGGIKELLTTLQCLADENIKCKEENKALVEERKEIQIRLALSKEENKTCMDALKNKTREYEDQYSQRENFQKEICRLREEIGQLKKRLVELLNENWNAKEALEMSNNENNGLIQALTSVQQHSPLLASDGQRMVLNAACCMEGIGTEEDPLTNKSLTCKPGYTNLPLALGNVKNNSFSGDLELPKSTSSQPTSQKEAEQVRRNTEDAEEELSCEPIAPEAANNGLESRVGNLDQEILGISKMVSNLRNDNAFLKVELMARIKDNVKLERTMVRINTERLRLQNYTKIVENQRDALEFEVKKLHRDYANLSNKITSHIKSDILSTCPTNVAVGRHHSPAPMEMAEAGHCMRNAEEYYDEGNQRIAAIQKRLEKHLEKLQRNQERLEQSRCLSGSHRSSLPQDRTRESYVQTEPRSLQPTGSPQR